MPKIGKIAIDCRLNPYGVYMQEMLKSIENQWWSLYPIRIGISNEITFQKNLLTVSPTQIGQNRKLKEITKSQQTSLSSELCRQAPHCGSIWKVGRFDDQNSDTTIKYL